MLAFLSNCSLSVCVSAEECVKHQQQDSQWWIYGIEYGESLLSWQAGFFSSSSDLFQAFVRMWKLIALLSTRMVWRQQCKQQGSKHLKISFQFALLLLYLSKLWMNENVHFLWTWYKLPQSNLPISSNDYRSRRRTIRVTDRPTVFAATKTCLIANHHFY